MGVIIFFVGGHSVGRAIRRQQRKEYNRKPFEENDEEILCMQKSPPTTALDLVINYVLMKQGGGACNEMVVRQWGHMPKEGWQRIWELRHQTTNSSLSLNMLRLKFCRTQMDTGLVSSGILDKGSLKQSIGSGREIEDDPNNHTVKEAENFKNQQHLTPTMLWVQFSALSK